MAFKNRIFWKASLLLCIRKIPCDSKFSKFPKHFETCSVKWENKVPEILSALLRLLITLAPGGGGAKGPPCGFSHIAPEVRNGRNGTRKRSVFQPWPQLTVCDCLQHIGWLSDKLQWVGDTGTPSDSSLSTMVSVHRSVADLQAGPRLVVGWRPAAHTAACPGHRQVAGRSGRPRTPHFRHARSVENVGRENVMVWRRIGIPSF